MKKLIAGAMAALAVAGPAAAAEKPKLSVKKVSNPPATAKAGDVFEVTGKVKNSGSVAGKAKVKVKLRSSRDGDSVAKIGSDRLRVPAKDTKRFEAQATIDESIPPGRYFLAACVKRHGTSGKSRCRVADSTVTITARSTFTPGARSAGDPLLPQIGNGGYDAKHYDIALDYDRAANTFNSASTQMTAVATQNLSEFSLDFQDLPVSGVTVNGAPAQFAQVEATPDLSPIPEVTQPMKLVVTPAAGIAQGTQFEVLVSYSGEPQVITDPDESIEGWIPACHSVSICDSVFVVGEPMGAQGWFPSNNYPSDKATFDTEITVADGEQAFGVGELVGPPVDNPDATTTWAWSEDDPTATYLVTGSNGVFTYNETTVTETATARTMPVYNAIDPSATPTQTTNINTLFGRNGEMIDFLGARYGPYPFDSYGAIYDRAPNVGYALEVQTKSHFASLNSGASTYLHELAHQWFGNAVTLEQWDDIWFNEGWAQFSEWEFNFETGASSTSPAEQFDNNYNDAGFDWSIAPAVLDGDPANLFAFEPTYLRGAMTIEGYREIVGDSIFFDFAKALQTQFAYGNVSTQEFIDLATQMSGLSGADLTLLGQYFQEWLFGTTKPTVTPDDF